MFWLSRALPFKFTCLWKTKEDVLSDLCTIIELDSQIICTYKNLTIKYVTKKTVWICRYIMHVWVRCECVTIMSSWGAVIDGTNEIIITNQRIYPRQKVSNITYIQIFFTIQGLILASRATIDQVNASNHQALLYPKFWTCIKYSIIINSHNIYALMKLFSQ